LSSFWVALFAPLGHAQFPLLKPKAEAPTTAAAAEPVDPRAKAEAQLAEARRQQEAGRSEQGRIQAAMRRACWSATASEFWIAW
jgi:hypothetical protein